MKTAKVLIVLLFVSVSVKIVIIFSLTAELSALESEYATLEEQYGWAMDMSKLNLGNPEGKEIVINEIQKQTDF